MPTQNEKAVREGELQLMDVSSGRRGRLLAASEALPNSGICATATAPTNQPRVAQGVCSWPDPELGRTGTSPAERIFWTCHRELK